MAHNPWKKKNCPVLYQKKPSKRRRIFMRLPNGGENIKALGFSISIIPNGIDLREVKG
jgi:hypothetical protein